MDSKMYCCIILNYNDIISEHLIHKDDDPYTKFLFKSNIASFYNLEINSFDFYPKSSYYSPFRNERINLRLIKNDDVPKNEMFSPNYNRKINLSDRRHFNNCKNSSFVSKEYDGEEHPFGRHRFNKHSENHSLRNVNEFTSFKTRPFHLKDYDDPFPGVA